MSNPTTPFGWQMPTATDLVTDLPADFEVFGQAVATSMADLLGGTSGQVLAKNSNTDMDFVWVTSDDANAIQNSIVDAKGDLIAASANDTPARLAVGSNYGFLQADSAQSTGLLWNNAAWTSYTPTIAANSGSFTTASATGFYTRIGKLCSVRISIVITTNGTAAGTVTATLPFTTAATDAQVGTHRENQSTGTMGSIVVAGGSSTSVWRTYNNLYPGGTGTTLVGQITYEVA
jgi:hypothetical protein